MDRGTLSRLHHRKCMSLPLQKTWYRGTTPATEKFIGCGCRASGEPGSGRSSVDAVALLLGLVHYIRFTGSGPG